MIMTGPTGAYAGLQARDGGYGRDQGSMRPTASGFALQPEGLGGGIVLGGGAAHAGVVDQDVETVQCRKAVFDEAGGYR